MIKRDYETEQALRERVTKDPSHAERVAAAAVLADFYELRGQPSRAALWRGPDRDLTQAQPDLLTRSSHVHAVDLRRNAMIWLLHHMLSIREIAKLFEISTTRTAQIIEQGDRDILAHAVTERRHPTLAASRRLAEAGALDGIKYHYPFGDPPPSGWLARNPARKRPRKARR